MGRKVLCSPRHKCERKNYEWHDTFPDAMQKSHSLGCTFPLERPDSLLFPLLMYLVLLYVARGFVWAFIIPTLLKRSFHLSNHVWNTKLCLFILSVPTLFKGFFKSFNDIVSYLLQWYLERKVAKRTYYLAQNATLWLSIARMGRESCSAILIPFLSPLLFSSKS